MLYWNLNGIRITELTKNLGTLEESKGNQPNLLFPKNPTNHKNDIWLLHYSKAFDDSTALHYKVLIIHSCNQVSAQQHLPTFPTSTPITLLYKAAM